MGSCELGIRVYVGFAAAHRIENHPKCGLIHGHNFAAEINVVLSAPRQILKRAIRPQGMLVDFGKIREAIRDEMDHKYLNEVLGFTPTSERLAMYICDKVYHILRQELKSRMSKSEIREIVAKIKVVVYENKNSSASFTMVERLDEP